MKQDFLFSEWIPQYLPSESNGWFSELIHQLLYAKSEGAVNPLLCITPDDIEAVMSNMTEIRNYYVEANWTEAGIVYISIRLGGISAECRNKLTPNDVKRSFLVAWRHHWQTTRGIDCYPFVVTLTLRQLVFGQPISIQGMRTLAKLQAEQRAFVNSKLNREALREERIAKALKSRE